MFFQILVETKDPSATVEYHYDNTCSVSWTCLAGIHIHRETFLLSTTQNTKWHTLSDTLIYHLGKGEIRL